MLERVKKAVERLLHFMVSAAFLVLIFACVLQVFTRFVNNTFVQMFAVLSYNIELIYVKWEG